MVASRKSSQSGPIRDYRRRERIAREYGEPRFPDYYFAKTQALSSYQAVYVGTAPAVPFDRSLLWSNQIMTDPELLQARTQKWRQNGQPVRTLDDARAFLHSAVFCPMYPFRPTILLPTFVGAG